MKSQTLMIALALALLTACQGESAVDGQADKPLDSLDLSRLAYEHDAQTEEGLRNSDDTFIPPGTPVEITGVCMLPRDVPLFAIDLPNQPAYDREDWPDGYRAHLENNAEVATMKKGQRYLVKGRIGLGDETMCYGAYFIDVESFTAID